VGWQATVRAPELARIMVDADIAALESPGSLLIDTPLLPVWS
jgi:GDPmannose 4,6-dehydratase